MMMRPLRAFIMPRMTALEARNTEVRLVSSIACQSSSFMRISNWSRVMPALLTRIEIAPNSLPMASMSASIALPSVTFSTRPPPPWAASRSPIACAPAAVVAVPITFAPSAASSSAIAAPMPRLAPVTSATSPSSNLPIVSACTAIEGANLTRNDRLRVAVAAPAWVAPGWQPGHAGVSGQ